MRSQTSRRRRRITGASALGIGVVLVASGCSDAAQRGFLPGYEDGEVTNHTASITQLWTGSWISALAVGVLVWGLILWCIAAYRKRKDDNVLPIQTRYHLPLEIMYTAVPIVMILVLFTHTDKVMEETQKVTGNADVTIEVIGKQWSWDFNYVDADVYETGVQENNVGDMKPIDGVPGTSDSLPTLYLPVNEKVQFRLMSRDVIHSFWIPAFLYKQDMFPNRTNVFEVIPEREGLYAGKCAELCGEYHSGMLFNVAVVSRAEFDAKMEELRAKGQEGSLPIEYSRLQHPNSAITSTEDEN